jgi:hypothetical protein
MAKIERQSSSNCTTVRARRLHHHQAGRRAERPNTSSPSTTNGTAEPILQVKEGKNTIKRTQLSCRTFSANAFRLTLHALAYNLQLHADAGDADDGGAR